ncbi:hypothetical protein IH992_20330 [Candidatus Poribacteria bacterium]|nr:hypothetical protein [Candidatus Poribacteria bacterium]
MATKLLGKFGAERLERYHKTGAIPFFNDYLEICRQDPNHPEVLRFSDPFEKTVARWDLDWRETHTEYVRRLSMTPESNLEAIGRKLKKTFSGAETYPDFSREFSEVTGYFHTKGDRENALKAARLSLKLYPKSVLSHAFLAHTHACFGEEDKARVYYKKAREIDPDDPAISARSLDRHASWLVYLGRLNEAMTLLEIAVELYPQQAWLYSRIADIHLERGKDYYQKALEVDPTHERARERLKRIR